jgi:putative pyruvate formate lyase activating enzyme
MAQYSPQYKACEYPEINRTLTEEEYDEVVEYALALGLEYAFVQECESQGHYLPDFAKARPFNPAS